MCMSHVHMCMHMCMCMHSMHMCMHMCMDMCMCVGAVRVLAARA
jgi:hypothetical protein